MKSTRSYEFALRESSEWSCTSRSRIVKKKTVMYSSKVKLRSFAKQSQNLQVQSSWITGEELSAMKKRAKNLSILHHIKTRPGKPTPSKRSEIVYNCHPAHYEIIGESLRGMEHYTDTSKARRLEWFRSNATSLAEAHQNLYKANRSKMACMYRESTKEAMVHSRKVAEEDAKAAAAILAEDLKEDDIDVAPPPPPSPSSSSLAAITTSQSSSAVCCTKYPELPMTDLTIS